ncbi:hypothetical protein GCM10007415_42110 [Parapedobacter pyrenivorans]|uniref:SMODS and SLOG-associating 2TM effector domain-containing protein n=1 Tax=Parapedobacter pyrenivorans TaxID=1305674 RepID=A0A917I274_9SPHI|nr:hypothetical protein GCM10007415_42110 [Parapedobacter pyrenivorans]
MCDPEDQKKLRQLQKYRTARNEYRTIAINQLSFANNLLLTLAVGFLPLGIDKEDFKTLSFRYTDDPSAEKVFLVLFIGSMTISIYWGVKVMFSRLYDFRLTRYILNIRVRILDKHNKRLGYEILRNTTKRNRCESLKLVWKARYHKFSQEEIDSFPSNQSAFKNHFKALREIAQDLGDASIKWTQNQSISLIIGVLFFLAHLLLL